MTIKFPVQALQETGPNTEKKLREIIDHLNKVIAFTSKLSPAPKALTIEEINAALSVSGSDPLNLTGLIGKTAQTQAAVSYDTFENRTQYDPGLYEDTFYVITDKGEPGGILYYSDGIKWVYLIGTQPGFSTFEILYADKQDTANALTAGDEGLYVSITDKNNVVYLHNGTKLAYFSGTQPVAFAGIAALEATLDIGNVSDDNLQINITDRNDIVYEWDSATTSFSYLSGTYQRTHAQMVSLAATLSSLDTGLLVQVTDWGDAIYEWSGTAFVYQSGGPYDRTYSQVAALAATLGVNDTDLPIRITDWNNQIYTWSGTAFVWTSGDIVEFTWAQFAAITFTSDDDGIRVYISTYNHFLKHVSGAWAWDVYQDDLMAGAGPVLFEADPGTGWAAYDGSTVYYMKSDGTRGSVTLPNLTTTPSYLKAGASSSGPNAPSGTTANESAHKHELPFEMHNDDHNEVHWAADNIFGVGGAMTESTRSSATAESGSGNYALSNAGSAHNHAVGTVEPENIVRKAFFRQ